LAERRDPAAEPLLVALLEEDGDELMRVVAARALASCGGGAATVALLRATETGPSQIREAAGVLSASLVKRRLSTVYYGSRAIPLGRFEPQPSARLGA
jgi:HEAT repeat protein